MKKTDLIIEGNSKTRIAGYLEIDHRRGVIYFHCGLEAVNAGYPATKLRLQGLAKPITLERGYMIDVNGEDNNGYGSCSECDAEYPDPHESDCTIASTTPGWRKNA